MKKTTYVCVFQYGIPKAHYHFFFLKKKAHDHYKRIIYICAFMKKKTDRFVEVDVE